VSRRQVVGNPLYRKAVEGALQSRDGDSGDGRQQGNGEE
jgi:hypothetical protein